MRYEKGLPAFCVHIRVLQRTELMLQYFDFTTYCSGVSEKSILKKYIVKVLM